jgi:hypothetical protein
MKKLIELVCGAKLLWKTVLLFETAAILILWTAVNGGFAAWHLSRRDVTKTVGEVRLICAETWLESNETCTLIWRQCARAD